MEFLLFLSLKTIKKIPVGNCDNYTHMLQMNALQMTYLLCCGNIPGLETYLFLLSLTWNLLKVQQ